jgi:hypothetical protein
MQSALELSLADFGKQVKLDDSQSMGIKGIVDRHLRKIHQQFMDFGKSASSRPSWEKPSEYRWGDDDEEAMYQVDEADFGPLSDQFLPAQGDAAMEQSRTRALSHDESTNDRPAKVGVGATGSRQSG